MARHGLIVWENAALMPNMILKCRIDVLRPHIYNIYLYIYIYICKQIKSSKESRARGARPDALSPRTTGKGGEAGADGAGGDDGQHRFGRPVRRCRDEHAMQLGGGGRTQQRRSSSEFSSNFAHGGRAAFLEVG